MTATALYVPTYATRSPYITVSEYKSAPTGVNVDQLSPRSDVQVQNDMLSVLIDRASSYADEICQQVLSATVDTQVGTYFVRAGVVKIPVDYTPLIQVNSLLVGSDASHLSTVTDLSNAWLQRKTVEIPVTGWFRSNRVKAALTYVSGFANTVTTVAQAVGDSTLTVASPVGIVSGLTLALFDAGNSEPVTVLSVSGNVVTLAAPLTKAHTFGVSLSALPAAIKQAVVFLTSALIKSRGSEAHVMASISAGPSRKSEIQDGGFEEIDLAFELLKPHRRSA
ncbi:hypothetical protein [Subtercola vilae]|uniref:Uncharacterized protein n=1 Tax=Subtercola vilae TaxID=2056433 RepID=A0A4T2BWP1_9MICO|nr:hypothetical protein [Subtercola vilae]TIH34971.1 hypothetical protein D4765_11805 [Subtercola vilae]